MKDVRLLLIYPDPSKTSPQHAPALSIFYPGAACERVGYRVIYHDDRWDPIYTLPSKACRADVVGVSTMAGEQLQRTIELIKLVRRLNSVSPIVGGGLFPTLEPSLCLREGLCDWVIRGEGEQALPQLLRHVLDGGNPYSIAGVIGKDEVESDPLPLDLSGQYVSPITVNTLPYFIRAAKENDMAFPTSRGCPYRCSFCVVPAMPGAGRRWREIPVEVWREDMNRVYAAQPFTRCEIVEDNFIGSVSRIERYGSWFRQHGVAWRALLRAKDVSEDRCKALVENGCDEVHIGAESGSDFILEHVMLKDESVEDVIRAAEVLSRHHLKATYTWIFDMPGETSNHRRQTFDLADRLSQIHRRNGRLCRQVFYHYTPLPGTLPRERMPRTLQEWANASAQGTTDSYYENVYWIGGLTFNSEPDGKTGRNFPGVSRWLIRPFEWASRFRWHLRFFHLFGLEKAIIKRLIEWRVRRRRQKAMPRRGSDERQYPNQPGTLEGITESHLQRYRFVADRGNGLKRKVLDIGCGCGYGALALTDHVASYIGVDRDAEAITLARKWYGGRNRAFRHSNAYDYLCTVPNRSFDAVMLFEFIEHVEVASAIKILKEVSRILTTDGRYYLSCPPSLGPGRMHSVYHKVEYSPLRLKKWINRFTDGSVIGQWVQLPPSYELVAVTDKSLTTFDPRDINSYVVAVRGRA